MSKAIICDRCKEMFPERPEGHVYIRVYADSPLPFNPCRSSSLPIPTINVDEKYDLCPSCQEEFSKFIRNIKGE